MVFFCSVDIFGHVRYAQNIICHRPHRSTGQFRAHNIQFCYFKSINQLPSRSSPTPHATVQFAYNFNASDLRFVHFIARYNFVQCCGNVSYWTQIGLYCAVVCACSIRGIKTKKQTNASHCLYSSTQPIVLLLEFSMKTKLNISDSHSFGPVWRSHTNLEYACHMNK